MGCVLGRASKRLRAVCLRPHQSAQAAITKHRRQQAIVFYPFRSPEAKIKVLAYSIALFLESLLIRT